jgi:hypothetical protein
MIKEFINKHNSEGWIIFYFSVITFIYTLSVSAFIQLYFIQVLFSQFNLVDGLAVFDSVGFDLIAKQKAIEISESGWHLWELRPKGIVDGNVTPGQSPAGIASIFYTLWTPKPFAMLPFNAIIHSLSGCLFVWLFRQFFSRTSAIIGGALFILNPAAMEWAAQLHRDGIFIFGNLMVLACLFHLLKVLNSGKMVNIIWSMVLGLSGTVVVWVARPYWVQVLFVTIILCLIILSILYGLIGKCINEK